MLLPPALGFSPHPPVSVYGTGTNHTIAAFLDSWNHALPYFYFGPHHAFGLPDGFSCQTPTSLAPVFSFPGCTVLLCPHSSDDSQYRNLNCCPSTTSFDLALGPDLPRADQLYSGNLGYSAWRIPTSISLLIPAFSLLTGPQLLTVLLRSDKNAPLPMYHYIPELRCCVSAPDIFGAGPLD